MRISPRSSRSQSSTAILPRGSRDRLKALPHASHSNGGRTGSPERRRYLRFRPIGRVRPGRRSPGAVETFVIPKELGDRLKEIARGERATLFMILLAAFQTLIHRYTGTDDIVVGAFVAGRNRVETEGLIGLFANTLAMRGDLAGDPTFRELLRKTRDAAFEVYAHQDLPFDMVVESIHPQRNLSYPPIFQVTFQVRNYPVEDTQLAGLEVEEVDFDPGISPFDLSFEVTEKAGRLFCKLIYNVDLFDRETISRMAGHLETLLGGIVNDPESPISRLPMLTSEERRQLLVEWNDTRARLSARVRSPVVRSAG